MFLRHSLSIRHHLYICKTGGLITKGVGAFAWHKKEACLRKVDTSTRAVEMKADGIEFSFAVTMGQLL